MKSRVINPPDQAVALYYNGHTAPRVTAKGEGAVAERILTLAEEYDIPLHTDPQLLRVLSQIPVGDEIPEALYLAVAQVIAFAYALQGKRPDTGA